MLVPEESSVELRELAQRCVSWSAPQATMHTLADHSQPGDKYMVSLTGL